MLPDLILKLQQLFHSDSSLTFNAYISLFFFNFAVLPNSTPLSAQKMLNHQYMHLSHLASITVMLFFFWTTSALSHLQYIQNSASRMLTCTKCSAHITPIKVSLTFKSLSCLAPSYLSDLLSPSIPSQPLQSSGCELLCVPRFHLSSMGGRSFSVLS